MTSTAPYTLKWGIMATGWIAQSEKPNASAPCTEMVLTSSTAFAKDLLTNPASRDVDDVRHEIAAVASSSSKDKADGFVTKVKVPGGTKTYGSYAELVADADVDIVYVATPHSHHFQNVMLALEAGKPVLCEKAFTVNAAQAKKLVETARAKKLFLMEAVWTRYFPISIKIRELVQAGAIGTVYRVIGTCPWHALKGTLLTPRKPTTPSTRISRMASWAGTIRTGW
jgi:predicted dehydrogenase